MLTEHGGRGTIHVSLQKIEASQPHVSLGIARPERCGSTQGVGGRLEAIVVERHQSQRRLSLRQIGLQLHGSPGRRLPLSNGFLTGTVAEIDHEDRAGAKCRPSLGELIGTARSDSTRLNAALKRAVGAGAQGSTLRLERPSRKRPLALLIAPMELEANSIGVPAAMVLISDPDRRAAPPKERLMEAYGLTAAEARVAQLLLREVGGLV